MKYVNIQIRKKKKRSQSCNASLPVMPVVIYTILQLVLVGCLFGLSRSRASPENEVNRCQQDDNRSSKGGIPEYKKGPP